MTAPDQSAVDGVPAATTVYSIGHSSHRFETFLDLLAWHQVVTVVDVRSRPYSKWAPQFRKALLARSLQGAGVGYRFLGAELGGLPDDDALYDGGGQVDYARRAEARDFQAGIDRLVEIAAGGRTALMCAEEDPARCHRHLLVTPALEQRGIVVVHIRGDGSLQPAAALRAPSRQLSLL